MPRVGSLSHLPGPPKSGFPPSPLQGSTRLRAELGGAGEEGASGRLGGLGDRVSAIVLFVTPGALRWPKGAGRATPGLRLTPLPVLPVRFPTAAPRRAGRRDAGVRAAFGQLGLWEEAGCGAARERGASPPSIPTSAREGGYPP